MKGNKINDLIAEIQDELNHIKILSSDIVETWKRLPKNQKVKSIYEESLALKLHNFYTACERIFCKISEDLNGGIPESKNWHKRILHQMTLELNDVRPPLISKKTELELIEYLGFRHVVRNIYGFEIKSERLSYLIEKSGQVIALFCKEVELFLGFLQSLSK